MSKLLTRDEFREAVFARDAHRCVVCEDPAQDAHHLIERRLWDDGGYYLNNGVSLCGPCHIEAEKTHYSVESLRALAGIKSRILPNSLYDDHEYDKWGNIIDNPTERIRGPLFYDESVQKILADRLHLFSHLHKYPRTSHLPWSPGKTDDDIIGIPAWQPYDDVVITEKMDGENTTMYHDTIHARSLDSGYHESRTWVKNFWANNIAGRIPEGDRIVGENLYAKHSIKYVNLPSYFQGFSYWEGDRCLNWMDTRYVFEELGITPVQVLWIGAYGDIQSWCDRWDKHYGSEYFEGYVVRSYQSFTLGEFDKNVLKYVRANHVTTDRHWRHAQIERNELEHQS